MITDRRWRWRRIIIAVMAATTLGIAGIVGTNQSARANTTSQQYLVVTPQWCATTTGNSPYAPIVLGACNNNAGSQRFATTGGSPFEIINLANGLCDTYPYPNGAPDGGKIVEGTCANAVTQLWQTNNPGLAGGLNYYLPGRTDNHGRHIAFDDANDVLKPFNKIDGSFLAPGYNSELWSFFG